MITRPLDLALLTLSLKAVALGAACGGGVAVGTGGQSSTGSSTQATGGASDAGTDADAAADTGVDDQGCPAWQMNKPGEPCAVEEGKECGGDTGFSFTFLRCCDGHWLAPDGGSSASPPCPG